jgi:curved DNA-binding protein CbpA
MNNSLHERAQKSCLCTMGLLETVTRLFGEGKSLYDVLGCAKGATAEEMKKSYLKQSLRFHPDKGGDAASFICVCSAYKLLSDAGLRAAYDETGEAGDEEDAGFGGSDQSDMDWAAYWRALFPQVSVDTIDGNGAQSALFFLPCPFLTRTQPLRPSTATRTRSARTSSKRTLSFSPTTQSVLTFGFLKRYTNAQGNMRQVVEVVILAENSDIERFVESYISPAIAAGQVRAFPALKRFEKGAQGPASKKQKKSAKSKSKSRAEDEEDLENDDDDLEEEEEEEVEEAPKKESKKKSAGKNKGKGKKQSKPKKKRSEEEDDDEEDENDEGQSKRKSKRRGSKKKRDANAEPPVDEEKVRAEIQKRREKSTGQLEALVGRLAAKHGKTRDADEPELPNEEEFARIQKSIAERSNKSKKD